MWRWVFYFQGKEKRVILSSGFSFTRLADAIESAMASTNDMIDMARDYSADPYLFDCVLEFRNDFKEDG